MADNQDNKTKNNVNKSVVFAKGKVPELLRKLEKYLGIALSLRSSTGEVVCKTDYFYGPCSFIRGNKEGCKRCRKVYKNIEDKIIRRKVPFVCLCYCGFLIFAVPLEFRGEMVGTLFGSQIIPESNGNIDNFRLQFAEAANELGFEETEEFFESFKNIKTLDNDLQRQQFLKYLDTIGQNFVEMALADKSWNEFIKEIKSQSPEFGVFK